MALFNLTSLVLAIAFHSTSLPALHLPPKTSALPASSITADSTVPLLTVDALNRMGAFWTKFKKEPPSIRDTAAARHIKPIKPDLTGLGIGSPMSDFNFERVDIEAMAAQYPSVMEDFKGAGLTPQQWARFRRALYTAMFIDHLQHIATFTLDPKSVRGQNVTFVRTHSKELAALQATGMYVPQISF